MDYSFEVPQQRKHFLGIRVDALLEMVLFFALLLVIDAWFFDGNRFWGVKPHPFWMIILIMTVFYGTAEGLVAAAMASAALLLFNLPPVMFDQDPFSYLLHVALTPMLWLATATVVGGFHDVRVGTIERVRSLYNEAKEREKGITAAYTKIEELARNLERQLVGELSGQTGVYKAASHIDAEDPAVAQEAVLDMFQSALNADKLSLYLVEGQKLVKVRDFGWAEGENFALKYAASEPLFKAVIGQGHILSVNDADAEAILSGEGVIAGPLMHSQTGEVIGMVKVEALPFTQLSVTTLALFDTLCKWVGTVVVNKEILKRSRQNQITEYAGVYTSNLLARDTELLSGLARRMGFELASIEISIKGGKGVKSDDRQALAIELLGVVQQVLRRTDILFLAEDKNTHFSLLVPGADAAGSQVVVDKIKSKIGNKASSLTFKVEKLVEPKDYSKFVKK